MDYKSIVSNIKEILHFKLYCMYIINAVSLIRTFHLSEQNFEPMNQRGSDKRGGTVLQNIWCCACMYVWQMPKLLHTRVIYCRVLLSVSRP